MDGVVLASRELAYMPLKLVVKLARPVKLVKQETLVKQVKLGQIGEAGQNR
jgi:hypothetical protein